MPASEPYQGIPVARNSDAPNIETTLDPLVAGLVVRTNLVFNSAAHRGAVLTGAQAPTTGMKTYLVAEKRWEYWDGAKWLYETPGPWQPLTLASGVIAQAGSPGYRLVAGRVEFRGTIQKSDGSPFPQGGATDLLAATIPAAIRPTDTRYFAVAASANAMVARAVVGVLGGLYITSVFNYDTTWVDLSGISYNLT